jgi:hypothetical protein
MFGICYQRKEDNFGGSQGDFGKGGQKKAVLLADKGTIL